MSSLGGSDIKEKLLLSKTQDRGRIVREVVALVRNGRLTVGDKLPSVLEMVKGYGLTQRKVLREIDELHSLGIIVRKPMSGSYITGDALEKVLEQDRTASPPPPLGFRDLSPFLTARSVEKELSLYVTDIHETALEFWRSTAASFTRARGTRVNLLTPAQGHLADLFGESPPHLVCTTTEVLTPLGTENFVTLAEEGNGLPAAGDCVLPVERYLRENPLRVWQPFSLTLEVLYVNESLSAQAFGPRWFPDDSAGMLDWLQEFSARIPASQAAGMALSDFFVAFCDAGAFIRMDHGIYQYSPKRIGDLMTRLREAGVPVLPDPTRLTEQFINGKLLWHHHCSWLSLCLEGCDFQWRAVPLLPPVDRRIPASQLVLAVPGGHGLIGEALDLLSWLISLPVQQAYGRVHGNLPVLRGVTEDHEFLQGHPLGRDTIMKTLQSSLIESPQYALSASLNSLLYAGYRGEKTMVDLLGALKQIPGLVCAT